MTTWIEALLFFPLKNRSKEPATAHGHLDARPFQEWTIRAENWGIRSKMILTGPDGDNGGRLAALERKTPAL